MLRMSVLLAALLLAACSSTTRRPTTPGPVPGSGTIVRGTPPGDVGGTRASVTPPPHAAPALIAAACADAPLLVAGQTVRTTTTGRADLFHATCAYGAASPDSVFRFRIERASHVAVRVTGSFDTVVHVRSACSDGDTEFACNDDSTDARHSAVEMDLPAGEYFAIVDGYAAGNSGFFTLTHQATPTSNAITAPRVLPRTPSGEGATIDRVAGQTGVMGSVTFAKRSYTPHGLTQATVDAPAPHFLVEALDAHDDVVAATETDEQGRFRFELAPGVTIRVRASTRTSLLGNDVRVVSDPGTERPYQISTLPFRVEGGERIALRAGVGGIEPAGAFNILAQFVRYLPYVQRGFTRPLPPLFAFWRRGNNSTLPQGSITAFLMDYHRHSGAYALQIQGGETGREDNSDSDQFDDPVILHEFSHFIVHTMSGHYSIGGMHPNGELHFPGQALDEGAASAMGCAVTAEGHYWDSAGLEPNGTILVDEDSESMRLVDRGIGSQNTSQSLLWDLIDGAEGITDRDNDGVAIGLTGLMRIYASFHEDPLAFPGIHTVLERAVELSLMTPAQATRIVRSPMDHGFVFPVPASDQWPQDLTLPAEIHGRVDGQTQPAPSGGRNVPANGLDAMRTYRFRIARRGLVTIDLAITGAGTQASGTDLDMVLFTRNLQLVGASDGQTAREGIHRFLDPGTYMLMVRDGDISTAMQHSGTNGNRAEYTLRVHQSNDFH